MRKSIYYLIAFCLFLSCTKQPTEIDDNNIFIDLPEISEIKIDGDNSDWENQGLQVTLFADELGNRPEKNDVNANFIAGWNNAGLHLFVDVQDDTLYTNPIAPWAGDGIEVFIFDTSTGINMMQYAIFPSEKTVAPHKLTYKHRVDKKLRQYNEDFRYSSKITSTGYQLEVLFPFSPLQISSQQGENIKLQVYVNDFDKQGDKNSYNLIWHHLGKTYANKYAAHKIRFSGNQNSDHAFTVKSYIQDNEQLKVDMYGPVSFKGKKIAVLLNGKTITTGKMSEVDENTCEYHFQHPYDEKSEHEFFIYANKELISIIKTIELARKYVKSEPPHPFEESIRMFEMEDRQNPPPPNATLFIGSSSIRMWATLKEDMEGIPVIHRGFGGSKAEDALYFIDRIVLPYKPIKIVFYEGDNDMGAGIPISEFIENTRQFVEIVRDSLPQTQIYLMSIKPSIKRKDIWENVQKANDSLQYLVKQYDNVEYIDVASNMLNKDGDIKTDIYIADSLHMNKEGYKIWTKTVREAIFD